MIELSKFDPQIHSLVYNPKIGNHKVIPKGQLEEYKEKGWMERHAVRPYVKELKKVGAKI